MGDQLIIAAEMLAIPLLKNACTDAHILLKKSATAEATVPTTLHKSCHSSFAPPTTPSQRE